ncbi:MAG TPA: aminotransferase class I/II-fold pyridoxal phosphate-dependent enzyme [Ktedonobacterales bacterium]
MRFETLAIHAGHESDPATGAVTPPLHLSTTFERQPDGSYPHGYVYIRTENPTRDALERLLAALEAGEEGDALEAVAFASGSAATAAVFQTLAPGDHVIAPDDVYHGTANLLRTVFGPWGVQTDFVDMTDLAAIEAALRPNTRLIWIETPSNPLLKITDIERVSALARQAGAALVADNTWATPALQHPLALGADLIVHSTTKYLGGHSDTLGGAVIGRASDTRFARVRALQKSTGGVMAPFDAWLTQRGARTLAYRMRGHSEHALAVARFLASRPEIAAVHYPGLETHPGYAVAARQMTLPGGMLSIQVDGGEDAAMALAARVQVFTRATSLGGVESLIEHRASIEGPQSRTPRNLLRLSIGLEHPDDLIADLDQALAAH